MCAPAPLAPPAATDLQAAYWAAGAASASVAGAAAYWAVGGAECHGSHGEHADHHQGDIPDYTSGQGVAVFSWPVKEPPCTFGRVVGVGVEWGGCAVSCVIGCSV